MCFFETKKGFYCILQQSLDCSNQKRISNFADILNLYYVLLCYIMNTAKNDAREKVFFFIKIKKYLYTDTYNV